MLLVAAVKVISSTSLCSQFSVSLAKPRYFEYSRFKTDDVAKKLSLISLVVAHLSGRINHLHASHPLISGELHLSCKVVNMLDQRCHDLPRPGASLGSHGINDILSKFLA